MKTIHLKAKSLSVVRNYVNKIRDIDNHPIESGIKDLVIGLRRWGIDTIGSCQGHLSGRHSPYIDVRYKDLKKASMLLWSWNDPNNKNKWVLCPIGVDLVVVMPSKTDKRRLYKNKKEAKKFGIALQKIPADYFKTVVDKKGIFIRENYSKFR